MKTTNYETSDADQALEWHVRSYEDYARMRIEEFETTVLLPLYDELDGLKGDIELDGVLAQGKMDRLVERWDNDQLIRALDDMNSLGHPKFQTRTERRVFMKSV